MFYLAPHPKLARPRRGSPLMFSVPWVEKYLSRVRPWHVVAIWGPFTLYMLYRASAHSGGLAIVAWAALGLFSWTLLEYLLHRCVFHFAPHPGSELQRIFRSLVPEVSAFQVGQVSLTVHLTCRRLRMRQLIQNASSDGAGRQKKSAAGKWLRRYHLVHHFQTPDRRYGITTPLWDRVFGTYPRDRYQGLPDDEARLEAGA